jgi:hypothetical protein
LQQKKTVFKVWVCVPFCFYSSSTQFKFFFLSFLFCTCVPRGNCNFPRKKFGKIVIHWSSEENVAENSYPREKNVAENRPLVIFVLTSPSLDKCNLRTQAEPRQLSMNERLQ